MGGSRSTGCARSRRARAPDVEVGLYSGRRQASVFEDARLIGGDRVHLRGRLRAGDRRRARVADRRGRALARAAARSTSRSRRPARRRCCSSATRGGSSTTRRGRPGARSRTCSGARSTSTRCGSCSTPQGFEWLRLVDNGVVRAASEQMRGVAVVHAYHLIPAAASKARAVARHMQARGYQPEDCIAVGDSREDMEVAARRRRVLARRQRARARPDAGDARPRAAAACGSLRGAYGAGVYEAVVTTLAERHVVEAPGSGGCRAARATVPGCCSRCGLPRRRRTRPGDAASMLGLGRVADRPPEPLDKLGREALALEVGAFMRSRNSTSLSPRSRRGDPCCRHDDLRHRLPPCCLIPGSAQAHSSAFIWA